MAADNKSLGKFQLVGLPSAPRGVPQVEVTFNIDTDGILHVTAKDKATGKSSSITIKESSHLDDSEIDRMRREAETHAEEDDKKAKDVEARNQADQLVYSVEKSLSELGEKVSPEERGKIEDQLRSVRDKLSQDASADELRQAMEELSKQAQQLAEQAYKQTAAESTGTPSDQEQETDREENDGDYVDAEYEEEK